MANRAYHQMIRRQRRKEILEAFFAGLFIFATMALLLFI